jgi:hypothetical protein
MLPDLERAERIGEFWGYPQSRAFAERLIGCEEAGRSGRPRHSISVEHQLPDDVVNGSPLWRKRPISIEAMLQHLGYQQVPNMFPLLICQSSASECFSDFPFVARSSENRSDNSQLILRQRSSRLFHWTERSLQRRAG